MLVVIVWVYILNSEHIAHLEMFDQMILIKSNNLFF